MMGKSPHGYDTKSWNPTTGCTPVSTGCAHCWARDYANRFYDEPAAFGRVAVYPERLDEPLRWRKPQRVAVCFMGDLFHKDVPDEFIDRVFAVMAICGAERYRCRGSRCNHDENSRGCWHQGEGREELAHTFLVLTKRPDRMAAYMKARGDWNQPIFDHLNDPEWSISYDMAGDMVNDLGWPLPNVWLGVSVENQETADERIPLLLETPAAHRWVSVEPLLASVILNRWLPLYNPNLMPPHTLGMVDWVVAGGESGPNHRPMEIAWLEDIVRQCDAAGVPCYVKQASHRYPGRQGRIRDALWARKQLPWPA